MKTTPMPKPNTKSRSSSTAEITVGIVSKKSSSHQNTSLSIGSPDSAERAAFSQSFLDLLKKQASQKASERRASISQDEYKEESEEESKEESKTSEDSNELMFMMDEDLQVEPPISAKKR